MLGLESGEIGIEDTLYSHFSNEYCYIEKLAIYLKQWIRTIRIRDCLRQTTFIDARNNDLYLTFNYTAVLETVYGISAERIIHIHGSLRNYTIDPVLGHGNLYRIQQIQEVIDKAQQMFDEKKTAICRVIERYYRCTLKDTNSYLWPLLGLENSNISEIIVIGHSLEGVDMPYFSMIDCLTGKSLIWTIYCHAPHEEMKKRQSLVDVGVDDCRIQTLSDKGFYNLHGL